MHPPDGTQQVPAQPRFPHSATPSYSSGFSTLPSAPRAGAKTCRHRIGVLLAPLMTCFVRASIGSSQAAPKPSLTHHHAKEHPVPNPCVHTPGTRQRLLPPDTPSDHTPQQSDLIGPVQLPPCLSQGIQPPPDMILPSPSIQRFPLRRQRQAKVPKHLCFSSHRRTPTLARSTRLPAASPPARRLRHSAASTAAGPQACSPLGCSSNVTTQASGSPWPRWGGGHADGSCGPTTVSDSPRCCCDCSKRATRRSNSSS